MTVSQLASRIESSIKTSFPSKVRVVAEISSVTNRTHYYFTLKDESAVISAVLFASSAKRLRTPPTHGQKVVASGKLDYYAPSGRLSLIVDKLEPVGEGDLEQRYKALCDDLRARGWFDPMTKRELPMFPRRIAVITSETSAALQDVLDTASKRCPAVDIVVIDARVQGDQAKSQIAGAINRISEHHESLGVDAIILTRGGGSLEDLWAFNEPVVAKAVHDCVVPIVAAIGHETDTTIAELVADERAATPTQAAMKLVPDRAALRAQLDALGRRLSRDLSTTLSSHFAHLNHLSSVGPLANPARLIEPSRIKLSPLARRVRGAAKHRLARETSDLDALAIRLSKHQPAAVHAERREHVAGLSRQLMRAMQTRLKSSVAYLNGAEREHNAIGPRQVLARGYSLTTAPDGSLLRSATGIKAGDELVTHLEDGRVISVVDGIAPPKAGSKGKGQQSPNAKPRSRAKNMKKSASPTPSLFNEKD